MQGKRRSSFFWLKIVSASTGLTLLVVVGLLVAQEMRTSDYQARFFADLAGKATYTAAVSYTHLTLPTNREV